VPRLWHGRFPSKHPLIPTIDASREASRWKRRKTTMSSSCLRHCRDGTPVVRAHLLLPVTITVHGVGMVTAPDLEMQRIQTSFFLKGLAMTGGALLITQLGVRRAERDSLRLPRS